MILKPNDLKLLSDFLAKKEIKNVQFELDSINSVKVLRFRCEDVLKKEYVLWIYPTESYKESSLYKPVQISTTERLEKATKS